MSSVPNFRTLLLRLLGRFCQPPDRFGEHEIDLAALRREACVDFRLAVFALRELVEQALEIAHEPVDPTTHLLILAIAGFEIVLQIGPSGLAEVLSIDMRLAGAETPLQVAVELAFQIGRAS